MDPVATESHSNPLSINAIYIVPQYSVINAVYDHIPQCPQVLEM